MLRYFFNITLVLISVTEEDLRNAVKIKRKFHCVKVASKTELLLHSDVLEIRR